MEAKPVRRARLRLLYDSTDVTQDIAPNLIKFTYQDFAHGQADSIAVTLADPARKWSGAWFPDKGAKLTAWIDVFDWPKPGQKASLPCGEFVIDEITLTGTPDQVTIKAASASVKKTIRRQKRSARWERIGFQQIARDVANRHDLKLVWELQDDFVFDRVDQSEESDLALMRRLAEDAGANIKVADEQLIVFSGEDYDSRPSTVAISRTGPELIDPGGYEFTSQAHSLYKAAKIRYWDPHMKMEVSETFNAPDQSISAQTLSIKRQAQDRAQALRLAKSYLRRANKAEVKARFRMVGNPAFAAGLTAAVSGFGALDATYFLESVSHSLAGNSGYQIAIEARRVLKGY